MTIEEKADKIREYCSGLRSCSECKLVKDANTTCFAHAEDVLRNYDILFGGSSQPQGDNVNHPQHYQGKNECIDVMIAMFGVDAVKHFCMCNAYKYRFRAQAKNGAEDIAKAEWYESKLIELLKLKE